MTAQIEIGTHQAVDWRSKSICDLDDTHFDTVEDLLDEGVPEDVAANTVMVAESRAKVMCMACPVVTACLDAAMREGEEYGVWGAKTPAERLAARPLWLKVKALDGLPVAPTVQKDQDALHTNPAINAKYKDRLRKAIATRDILLLRPGFTFYSEKNKTRKYEEMIQVMDMLISNPAGAHKALAARIGKSATWFNDIVRETFEALDIT